MHSEEYLEAILVWAGTGASPLAQRWCAEHGLRTVPMRAGLLITGDQASFDAAFHVDLQRAEPPVSLRVPDELRHVVSSITIPRDRRITAESGGSP